MFKKSKKMGKSNFSQILRFAGCFATSHCYFLITMAIEKLYYTISEVAELLRLNQSVLRYWESEFSHIQPRKTKKGDRLYTQKDIDELRMIFYLLKEKGYTIEGAKRHLREVKLPNTSFQIVQSLTKIKLQLEQLKNNL